MAPIVLDPMSDLTSFHSDPPPRPSRPWLARVLFVLVVVVLPVTTTVIAVERFSQLSVLDEYAHIDYLRRVEDGEVPRMGDKIRQETARDVACRTIEGRQISDCELAEIPIGSIDAEGYSYEAQQPPLYYIVTALLRQPIALVVNGYVNSARLTGALWLVSGLAVLWWFLRQRMHAGPTAAAVVCGMVALSPTVMAQAAVVNNDASSVLSGAVLLVLYDEVRRRPSPRVILVASVVAVVLVLAKPLAILGLGAVTIALLLGALARRTGLRQVGLLMVPAVAGLLTYQGWQQVRDLRAVVPYSVVTEVLLRPRTTLDEFPFDAVGILAPRFLSSYWEPASSMFTEASVAGLTTVVGLFLVAAPSISAALGQGRRDLQPLHIGIITVLLVAPPLLLAQAYFQVHKGGGVNARYVLTMLPLTVTAVVPWLEARGTRWFSVGLVSVLGVVALGGLLTYEVGGVS